MLQDGLAAAEQPEIAEKLELKPGHVGKLKHDALKKVRAALKDGAS